jgi:hypothetical protein
MCMACVEYAKDKLNADEFISALREMTWDDKKHADEVAALVKALAGQPEALKKELEKLMARSRA